MLQGGVTVAAIEKMPGHPRLYRRRATYYHRAAIPKDIADTYPKSEETFSLKTTDHREAIRLVRIAAVEVDQRFEAHRRLQKLPVQQELTPQQLKHIGDVYFTHRLEEDEEMRADGFVGYNFAKSFDDAEEMHSNFVKDVRRQYARGEPDLFIWDEAEEILSWDDVNIKLAKDSPSWPVLARTMQEAYIKAGEAIAKRYAGEIVPTPETTAPIKQTPHTSPLLSALFSDRKAEAQRSGAWSAKLSDDYDTWTNLFIELKGDRPITEYKKPDARDFKTLLLGLPTNRNKLQQTKGLSAIEAAEAANRHDLPTLAVSTINKALGRLQATWVWADKQLDDDVPDIFGPMKLDEGESARDQADPFSADQLQAIFKTPIYTGCQSERFRKKHGNEDMSHTSWYWLPLLGLFTGARLNELCQLREEDVCERDGIPYLHLREGEETQRIKLHKERVVPIHDTLIHLGFLRMVESQRSAGSDRVFPDLKRDSSGYYSNKSSKDFNDYIDALGIKTKKTKFHSFRHNFKDACRHSGVHPDINDILLGHALPGMSGRYGNAQVPLKKLNEAVQSVAFEGLTLDHLTGYLPGEK